MTLAYEETINAAWLKQQAILWRADGLKCYRAHRDDEAIRLLNMADDAWHLLHTIQDLKPRQPRRGAS